MFVLTPNFKPRWFEFRKNISRFLVYLARKIEPECPYVYSKFMEEIIKANINNINYGHSILKNESIDPINELKEPNETRY